jgi:dienelactone hydrolase
MSFHASGQRLVRPARFPLAFRALFMVCLALPLILWPSISASAATPASISIPADLTATPVSFQGSGGVTLHGTSIDPAHAQEGRPGIVLVSGSGTGRRSQTQPDAVAFAQQGLSTLIYDKRSVGYSAFQRNYSQLADDALAAVQTLRAHAGVDPKKVGIWGVSEGGWVAPLAAERSTDVAFVIVVGANAISPLRQQTWAVANALHREGVSGSLLNRAEPTMFRLVANIGIFAEAYYDAAAVLQHVRQPLLGVWGSDDQSTPPGQNPPLFAQALQQGGNTRYTFRFFPGATHDIHQSSDGGVTSLPEFAPGYAELVGSWVRAVTSGRLPQVDAPAPPPQDWLSVPVSPLSWWESAWVQLAAFLLLLAAFASYPLMALLRRLRGRSLPAAVGTPARLLSGTGVTVVLCFFVYMLSLLIGVGTDGREVIPDPVLAGRPLLWLLLQTLALVIVGAEVATAVAWRRAGNLVSLGERRRLGLLQAGGVLFVLWALYWGLLLP